MKKKTIIVSSVIALALVVVMALKSSGSRKTDVSFETVKAERGKISYAVTATGTIEAIITVKVGTQVSGILKGVYVDFNDVVKKGQVLAKLDETSLKAQAEQSQAQLDQALAQFTLNESTYNRLKALYDKNLISQADYDEAVFNYENSKAAVINSKSNLARSKVNLEYATITSPIDGVVLNRAVEEGQTVAASFNTPELFTIVNDLTQMEVKTSVDEADIGKVKVDQRVEFTVDAYPDMKFEGIVSEVRLQPVTTNSVVTYNVILHAPNPDMKLMPGMTATATIYAEERENALLIPGKALRFKPDTSYVNKLLAERAATMSREGNTSQRMPGRQTPSGEDSVRENKSQSSFISDQSTAKKRIVWVRDPQIGLIRYLVSIGIENGTSVEVLSGLKEGDEVIVSMSMGEEKVSAQGRVKEGQRIPAMGPGYGG